MALYKEFKIPKRTGGYRIICAPSPELLSRQQRLLPLLTEYFVNLAGSYDVLKHMHGFIRGRNAVTAATQHIGYETTISMDIADFFESVKPNEDLIELTNDYQALYAKNRAPQGFATSPILANISLIVAIKAIQVSLDRELGRNNYAFTIYADDIQISTNGLGVPYLTTIVQHIVEDNLAHAGFKLHPTKTYCQQAKFGYRRILGINVGDTEIRATRKIMRRIRAAAYQQNGPSLGGLTTWSKNYPPRNPLLDI